MQDDASRVTEAEFWAAHEKWGKPQPYLVTIGDPPMTLYFEHGPGSKVLGRIEWPYFKTDPYEFYVVNPK